jgi:uncharacterized protein DUF6932
MSPFPTSLTRIANKLCGSPARKEIFRGLLAYRQELGNIGMDEGFRWLSGSFMEDIESRESRNPNDIDAVTFCHKPIAAKDDSGWFWCECRRRVSGPDFQCLGSRGRRATDANGRVFQSIWQFFGYMHSSKATFRLVEGDRDETFDRNAVERAWRRAESSEVDEEHVHLQGRLLGVIPMRRRFEFEPDDRTQIIEGSLGQLQP